MKIVFFDSKPEYQDMYTESLGHEHSLVFYPDHIQDVPDSSWHDADIISVKVLSRVTRDIIERLSNLKLIITRSTGYDHIDLAYANEHSILVSHIPDYGAKTVAEYAWSLLLSISRHTHLAEARLHASPRVSHEGLMGFDIFDKTIGVIGTGAIGKNFARIAHGFGCTILLYDIHPDTDFAHEVGASYVDSLPDILSASDILSLHLPLLPSTRHILDAQALSLTKPGVVLVNTARGGLIDTHALFDLLEAGHIQAAGLDVLEREDLFFKEERSTSITDTEMLDIMDINQKLIDLPQVLVTPHVAFYTREAEERIVQSTITALLSFSNGDPVPHTLTS